MTVKADDADINCLGFTTVRETLSLLQLASSPPFPIGKGQNFSLWNMVLYPFYAVSSGL